MFLLSSSKNSCGLAPLGLSFDKNLSSVLLLDAKSFLLAIADLTAEPVPPITPKNKEPSKPNFILFITSLDASVESLGVNCVGPPPNKSPIVPTDSGSPINIASDTPAAPAPPSVAANLPLALRAVFILSSNLGSVILK